MKRKLALAILVLALIGPAFPLINLIRGVPVRTSFQDLPVETPATARAKEVLARKCVMCHMEDPALPFYAGFPIASSLMRRHVTDGLAKWDAKSLVAEPARFEASLAKREQSVELGTMPILPCLLMHWDGSLTATERDAGLAWVREVRGRHFARGLSAAEYATYPVQPLPPAWPGPLHARKVELGRRLYDDKRLSTDDTISCASCHDLAKGGTDQRQFSLGVRQQLGAINAPTVFNAALNFVQFWDGRARDLADQAGSPPLNPVEMASKWEEIIGKLSGDADLTALCREVFGDDQWAPHRIQEAIAEFERTLITPDSPVDRYLKGERAALTDAEARGLALLKEHSCATCHTGEAMGGKSYEGPQAPARFDAALGRAPGKDDYGRFNVTTNEADRFKVKAPQLRNLALTFPYLHDGSQTDLRKVGRLMHDHFVPELNRRPLSDADVEALVAVLVRNTGVLAGRPL